MSSAFRYEDLLCRHGWTINLAAILLLAVVCSVLFLGEYGRFPEHVSRPVPGFPKIALEAGKDYSVFRNLTGAAEAPPGAGALSKLYRLAGTFFAFEAGLDSRKAIIDELAAKTQRIAAEGDVIGDTTVVSILKDHILLRSVDGIEERLWLGFSGGGPASTAGTVTGIPIRDESPYGARQIGENRRVFSRKSLLDYYTELRNNPNRLLKIFDSLKPEYDENRKITGYRLGIEGESKFFTATGLQESDIVRQVNSMRMTSRRRAEYFINEFVNDRVNAFILEIERNGKPQKLIYEVR